MKLLHYSMLLSFLLTITVCSTPSVLNLTSQNFNTTITTNKYVMVKFYAPWCVHCKTMIPEYQRLAEMTYNLGIVIAEVDATVEQDIGQLYNVQGFPSMRFFVDSEAVDYTGPRTADAMYKWIQRVATTVLQQVNENTVDGLKKQKTFVVYYGYDKQKQRTIKLLNIIDEVVTYYLSPLKQGQTQKIILYRINKQPIQYQLPDQQLTIKKLEQWVMLNTLPTIIPLSTKERLEYVFYDKPEEKDAALLFKGDDLTEEVLKRLQQVCEENKDRLKCSLVDNSMDIYLGVKNYVRSKGQTLLVLTRDALKKAYTYPLPLEQLTNQSWFEFLQQIKQDKHKDLADISTDILQLQHAKILTDDNYTEFINSNRMVLVEFVSPGCAHCVEFSDQFDSLAKEVYAGESDLEVAAIDLKRNKEMGYKLKVFDFPSLRLYLNGAFIDYQGKLNKTKILEFVTKVNSTKLIEVSSLDEVPSPAVVIYDSSEITALRLLPVIFTRHPVYLIKQGNQPKVVLKLPSEQDKTYPTDTKNLTVPLVSQWLYTESQPLLVNLLMTSMEGKLKDAMQNQIHLLGIIDVQPQLTDLLKQTLSTYCKNSTLVCGHAKKGQPHFDQLMTWANVEQDIQHSNIFYVDTQKFQKFLYNQNVRQITSQSIQQFVSDVKQGKIKPTHQVQQVSNREAPIATETQASEQVKQTDKIQKEQNQNEEL